MFRHKTEVSCGGIVMKGSPTKILLVKVQNLQGKRVWTLPKGHIEKGETWTQTALREVREETGWECGIHKKDKRPFKRIQYFFIRGESKILKKVIWYRMVPIKKTGSHDPDEILRTRWATFAQAKKLFQYPSDKKILEKLQARSE